MKERINACVHMCICGFQPFLPLYSLHFFYYSLIVSVRSLKGFKFSREHAHFAVFTVRYVDAHAFYIKLYFLKVSFCLVETIETGAQRRSKTKSKQIR